MGCFEKADDLFQGLRLADMSIDKCRIYCKDLNFTIAKLQNGSLCFCSDDVKDFKLVDDSMCRRECNGNSEQVCGDENTFSVYDGMFKRLLK